jgi:hypothetical protein
VLLLWLALLLLSLLVPLLPPGRLLLLARKHKQPLHGGRWYLIMLVVMFVISPRTMQSSAPSDLQPFAAVQLHAMTYHPAPPPCSAIVPYPRMQTSALVP